MEAVGETLLGSQQITIKGLLKSVLSPVGCLTAYLWAGLYKASIMQHITIDLTALLGGILILVTAREVILKRGVCRLPLPFCLVYGMYVGSLILSLTYTIAPINVAESKLFRLVAVDGLAVVATLLLISDVEKMENFMKVQILVGLVLSLIVLANSVPGQWNLRRLGGSSYIADSRAIGMGLSYCVGRFGFRTLLQQALVVTLFAGQLVLAARGPLISACASCCMLMLYRLRSSKKLSVTVLIGLIVGMYAIISLDSQGYFFTMKQRMAVLFSRTESTSLSARVILLESAVDMFFQRPVFGWGLSSFPFYAGSSNVENAPHNLIFEMLCEVGIMGCLPFVVLLIITVYRLYIIRQRVSTELVQGLWGALLFWILTIPMLGLLSARPFMALLAAINAFGIDFHKRRGPAISVVQRSGQS